MTIQRESVTAKNLIQLRKVLYRVAEGKVREEEKPRRLYSCMGVNREKPYYQLDVFFTCGAPACAIAWFLREKGITYQGYRKLGHSYAWHVEEHFPGLSQNQRNSIFNTEGCGRAGASARKAARFVGRFIRENVA